MWTCGIQHTQQNRDTFRQHSAIARTVVTLKVFQSIEQLHATRDHRVVLHALVVVTHLLQDQMHFATQGFGISTQGGYSKRTVATRQTLSVLVRKRPHSTQKAITTFNGSVIPFQRSFWWRSEHRIEPRCIRTVFFNQILRINAIVLGLRHRAHTFVINRCANRQLSV